MNGFTQFFAQSLIIVGLIVFAIQSFIKYFLKTQIKIHEQQLNNLSIQYQIRYSKLHEQRAECLKDLYSNLHQLEQELQNVTTIFQGADWALDNTRRKEAFTQLIKCEDQLERNRIYFTEGFCNELESILLSCKQAIFDMDKAKIKYKQEAANASLGRPMPFKPEGSSIFKWATVAEKVDREIKAKRIELAKSFREILGVTDHTKNS